MASRLRIKESNAALVESLASSMSLPMPIAQILVSRGIDTTEKASAFFDTSLSQLPSPFDLSNMQEACEQMSQRIVADKSIMIHGDFDADGITSSALFALFFHEIQAPVEVFLPNRLDEGHGISDKAIEKAVTQNIDLMVTCDCGSSSFKAAQTLLDHGIKLIVTDHHHVQEGMPDGVLLVNPQQSGNEASLEELSGVGVVFLTLMALRKTLREQGYFNDERPEPNLKKYLDVVALGTIADLAPITGMNRILVANGLEVLHQQPQIGVAALKQVVGLVDQPTMVSDDIGFKLAPKINAAARLGKSDRAFELLTVTDPISAKILAVELDGYNIERKKKQDSMVAHAMPEALRQVKMGNEVLVLADDSYHPGIVGLMAQKMAQTFGKPTFIFTFEDQWAKGSARSRSGVHLVDLMKGMERYFTEFGGHEAAGGGKMLREHLPMFAQEVQPLCREMFGSQQTPETWADARLPLSDIHDIFFYGLDKLRPFGMGHPQPIFMADVEVVGQPIEVGQDHLKAKVTDGRGHTFSCIAFGRFKDWRHEFQRQIRIAYRPDKQYFRGRMQVSLQLVDFEPR